MFQRNKSMYNCFISQYNFSSFLPLLIASHRTDLLFSHKSQSMVNRNKIENIRERALIQQIDRSGSVNLRNYSDKFWVRFVCNGWTVFYSTQALSKNLSILFIQQWRWHCPILWFKNRSTKNKSKHITQSKCCLKSPLISVSNIA